MNRDYITSWIDIALKDIETSNTLLDNKLYSNAFYHFQQASEKGLKAYFFLMKIFTKENDALNANHFTLKVFKKLLNKQTIDLKTLDNYNFDNLIGEENFNNYSKSLKEAIYLTPNKDEIFEYSSQHINSLLTELKKIKNLKFDFPHNYNKILIDNCENLIEWHKSINKKSGEKLEKELNYLIKNELDTIIEINKKSIKIIFEYQYYGSALYICALLTHNHNNLSRYPKIDFNPLKYYNLRRPLIKKLPELNKILKSVLLKLKKSELMK